MICCNGCPKSGLGLLMKLCGLSGKRDSNLILERYPNHEHLHTMILIAGQQKFEITPDQAWYPDDRWFALCHASWPTPEIENERILTIFRDPRNALVSYARWHVQEGAIPQESIHDFMDLLLRKGSKDTGNWVDWQRSFLPWKNRAWTRFEGLYNREEITRIARKLGIKMQQLQSKTVLERLHDGEAGGHNHRSTWSGRHSRWEEWWNPKMEEAWKTAGGPRLLEEMEYD